jgi:flagellin
MRIGSNLSGTDFAAVTNLNKIFQQLTAIGTQLSTGRRINQGSDNPAGQLAIESLQSELAAVEQASRNAAYAQYSLDLADAGIKQSLDLLRTIRGNVVAAGNETLSEKQRAALQTEVDAALKGIDQIGANTSIAGHKLLNGGIPRFQISPDPSQSVSAQMPNINTTTLGGMAGTLSDLASGAIANLQNGDLKKAQVILDQAESQILSAWVETAAFEKYSLGTASESLNSTWLNLTSVESQIGDTDYAQAMSDMVSAQILVKSLIGVMKSTLQNRSLVVELLKT